MFRISFKKLIADDIYLMDIKARTVVDLAKVGESIIVKRDENFQGINMKIEECDKEMGIITVIFKGKECGAEAMKTLQEGKYVKELIFK